MKVYNSVRQGDQDEKIVCDSFDICDIQWVDQVKWISLKVLKRI